MSAPPKWGMPRSLWQVQWFPMTSHKTVLNWPSGRRLFHRGRQRGWLLLVVVAAAVAALAAVFP